MLLAGVASKAPLTILGGVLGVVLALPVIHNSYWLKKLDPSFSCDRLYGILTILFIFSIYGFSSSIETQADAKQLGFSSLDEMKFFKSRGYKTMSEYKDAKNLTTEYFSVECLAADDLGYRSKCLKKKVSWKGVISSFGSYGATVDVLNDDGTYPKKTFKIDSPSIASKLNNSGAGKMIIFDGVIGRRNYVNPDIDDATIFWLESDSEKEARFLEKEEAERAEMQAHLNDAGWLVDKFNYQASSACRPQIERLAKYGFEWVDGWLESKFQSFIAGTVSPGVFIITGDKAKFQNGFGAWQMMVYQCEYDAVNKKVVSVSAFPR